MAFDAHGTEQTIARMSRINGKQGNYCISNGTHANRMGTQSMTDEIPTGDPTTVPVSELEELVERWQEAAEYADENATVGEYDGIMGCKDELQELIAEYDPKQ